MRHLISSIILLLSFVIGFLFISCDPDTADYYYEVTGTASKVNVTYSDLFGGTLQESNKSLPWTSKTFTNDSPENRIFAYISAQNQTNTGTVTVSIYRNGKMEKTASSTGAYVIASTSYSNK